MLLVFHKPYDVLSQFTQDHPGQRTLAEFGFPKNVWPIGLVVDHLTRAILTLVGDRVLHRLDPDFTEAQETTAKVWAPVGHLAHAAVWVFGAKEIELPERQRQYSGPLQW